MNIQSRGARRFTLADRARPPSLRQPRPTPSSGRPARLSDTSSRFRSSPNTLPIAGGFQPNKQPNFQRCHYHEDSDGRVSIKGLDHSKRMLDLTEGLIRRGYSEPIIKLILGGNAVCTGRDSGLQRPLHSQPRTVPVKRAARGSAALGISISIHRLMTPEWSANKKQSDSNNPFLSCFRVASIVFVSIDIADSAFQLNPNVV